MAASLSREHKHELGLKLLQESLEGEPKPSEPRRVVCVRCGMVYVAATPNTLHDCDVKTDD